MNTSIKNTIETVRREYALDQYKAERAIIQAPFGQAHFDEGIQWLTDSEAVNELSKTGSIIVIVITSKETNIGNVPDWIQCIQVDKVPDWPKQPTYQNRFFKWAIPFLFKNVKCSIYMDSDLIITKKTGALLSLFKILEAEEFVVTHHNVRSGWEDEHHAITECLRWKLKRGEENPTKSKNRFKTLQKQRDFFNQQRVTKQSMVFQANFVGRMHNSKYNLLSQTVLEHIFKYSERDQLALIYAVFKTKLTPFSLPEGEILFTAFATSLNSSTNCFIDSHPVSMQRFKEMHQISFGNIKKVSVIMPSFNHDKYIREAVDSVLRQTFKDWELIIVDDGSTDQSVDIIWEYVNKYPDKIKLLTHPNHENRNIAQTYRLGIKNTTGDYVAFLESDDIWLEDSLFMKIKAFDKHNDIVLTYTDVEIFGEKGTWRENRESVIKNIRKTNNKHKNKPFYASELRNKNIVPSFSTVMAKRDVFDNVDFSIPKEYEMWLDLWLWRQLSLKGKFFYIPRKTAKWRIHKASYNSKIDRKLNSPSQHFNSFLKELNASFKIPKKKTVAIVVPMYNEVLSADAQISLRHLEHYLGGYDKFIIAPKNLNVLHKRSTFSIYPLDRKYFVSKESYSRLLLSKSFYEAFSDYEYILIYQLDSLVFSDQLLEWCKKGYDYMGAPWYKTETMKAEGWAPDVDCVGNGGLSLRKVESHLKVLRIYQSPLNITKCKLIAYLRLFKYYLSRIPRKTLDLLTRKQKLSSILQNAYIQKRDTDYRQVEDLFWAFEAKKYYPDFKIPPPDIAVSFSFETGPRYCFEKNNQRLPFGCHAWGKYDRKFWEPYLLKESVGPNQYQQ